MLVEQEGPCLHASKVAVQYFLFVVLFQKADMNMAAAQAMYVGIAAAACSVLEAYFDCPSVEYVLHRSSARFDSGLGWREDQDRPSAHHLVDFACAWCGSLHDVDLDHEGGEAMLQNSTLSKLLAVESRISSRSWCCTCWCPVSEALLNTTVRISTRDDYTKDIASEDHVMAVSRLTALAHVRRAT